MRPGNDRVAKRLDRFLLSKSLLRGPLLSRQWVAPEGISDHSPILLDLVGAAKKPPSPVKFNPLWLDYPSYLSVIKEFWVPYNSHLPESPTIQFKANLKRAKEASIAWNKKRKQDENKSLTEIEGKMMEWHQNETLGTLSEDQKEELKSLNLLKRKILQNREQKWRMKNSALWLKAREENTKYFHHFANNRKCLNTI